MGMSDKGTSRYGPWRRCSSCGGVCYWHDEAWVCDSCGDEWYEETFLLVEQPEQSQQTKETA